MNLLFVCRGNIGRSQMAKAFCKRYHPSYIADACGTGVGSKDGQRLGDILNDGVEKDIGVMAELGIDISDYRRKQITPELISAADQVIVMAEPETWPDYLTASSKVKVWEVKNPKDANLDDVRIIRDKVRELVQQL